MAAFFLVPRLLLRKVQRRVRPAHQIRLVAGTGARPTDFS